MTLNDDQARARIDGILLQLRARLQAIQLTGGWVMIVIVFAWFICLYVKIKIVWWLGIALSVAAVFGSAFAGALSILFANQIALAFACRRFARSFGRDSANFRRARRELDDPDKHNETADLLSHALDLRSPQLSLYAGPNVGANPRIAIMHLLSTISDRDKLRTQFATMLGVELILLLIVLRGAVKLPEMPSLWLSLLFIVLVVVAVVLWAFLCYRLDLRRARRTMMGIYSVDSEIYPVVYSCLQEIGGVPARALLALLPAPSLPVPPDQKNVKKANGVTDVADAAPKSSGTEGARLPTPRLRIIPARHSTEGSPAVRSATDAPFAAETTNDMSASKMSTAEALEVTPSVSSSAPFMGVSVAADRRVQDSGFVDAIQIAYSAEIKKVASALEESFSALVCCDKILVEHLWKEIVNASGREAVVLEVIDAAAGDAGLLQQQIKYLKACIENVDTRRVLVVPNLDLLAGGSSYPSDAAREFIEHVYRASSCVILGFSDPSLELPKVLTSRFSIRCNIEGVPKLVYGTDGQAVPISTALIGPDEVAQIKGFDPEALYPHISGLNPIDIRRIVRYAIRVGGEDVGMDDVYETIRMFKVNVSETFDIHDVSFSDIGGYEEVKSQLDRALSLMQGYFELPNEKLRHELIPRGFLLYGPPGTGKTLFAKAVAHRLRATVAVVAGPEIVDAYWGATERRIRQLFADARRNAPAVVVFDEFDAIAPVRSSGPINSSHFMASIVAQILTEMDGLRAQVPILVIATTNRIELIDPAFLRPSRFVPIAIGLPDRDARRAIAKIHCGRFGVPVSEEVLEAIAVATASFSGDEIKSIFRDLCVTQVSGQLGLHSTDYELGRLVGQVQRRKEKRAIYTTQDAGLVPEAVARASETEEAGMIPVVIRDLS